MKIIQITSYYPPHLGGQENVAREISERLAKKGHDVEVFTSDIGCPKEKQLKSTKNLKIHYLKAWEFAHTPIIPAIIKKLKNIREKSILHIHTGQAFTPEIVYLISKIKKIKYIVQLHIDASPSSKLGKYILEPYKKVFLKRVLRNASKISVLTKDYKELIEKKYNIDSKKIVIIPNGVGEDFFTKKTKKNNVFKLLYVGRLSSQKNPQKLIESVQNCQEKLILDIVGDGELLEECKRIVKMREIKNIIFHGRKDGKELIKFYQNANALINTSNEEAFPLTILEASASAIPIIASDVKGNHDVVKGNGILVNPTTANDFAKEIDKLIKNTKIQKELSKKSLKFAIKHKWDNIIPKFEKLYEEVLNEE